MQAFFKIWIEAHSSKAHQSFWPVLNRETLTAINISSKLDISWDGELHLFTSSLIQQEQANPSICTGMWTQLPSPNMPLWPNANVIVRSVSASCLLAWLCMLLDLSITSMNYHKTRGGRDPWIVTQLHLLLEADQSPVPEQTCRFIRCSTHEEVWA